MNIKILHNGKYFNFMSFVIQEDGSVYISLLKKGKFQERQSYDSEKSGWEREFLQHPQEATRKISYHGSGEVHYTNTKNPRRFCEPIINIQEKNLIGHYLLPKITYLDESRDKNDDDYIIEVNNKEPYQFSLFLAPWDTSHEIAIHFKKLFSFVVELTTPTVTILHDSFSDVFITPKIGKYESAPLPRDKAFILFHQKINNWKKVILYSPNKEGVWKIIASQPMRSAPQLHIEFKDQSLRFEQLEVKPIQSKYILKFKVLGKGGCIKHPVDIVSFSLDARLGVVQ